MNVRKFIAANARDALRKVKETLGDDAIILSNRGIPGGVEIMAVAARDMAMIVPTPVADVPPAPRVTSRPTPTQGEVDDDYRVLLSSARARAAQPVAPVVPSSVAAEHAAPLVSTVNRPRKSISSATASHALVNAGIPKNAALRNLDLGKMPVSPPSTVKAPGRDHQAASLMTAREVVRESVKEVASEGVPQAVMDEIRSLRKIVEQHLAGIAWGEAGRSQPIKTEVMRQMLDAGFSPQLARDMLAELPQEMDASQASAWVRGVADRSLLTIANEDDIVDRGGVFALVGPTGVGKTTTTAKLAARCVLRHGPSKVALVTTDGYRIGAHEQLRIYGRILGVSVYMVKDAGELEQTLKELRHKHMVLVDTMGMSQKDKLVAELNEMLVRCDVQRLLLLTATARGDTLDDVVRAYDGGHLAGCILTKIDEATSLATPLDVIMRHGLRLHYVSNGQRVPEDLHMPNRGYLLHRAFREVPESSPHKYDGVEPGLMMANAPLASSGGRRG